MRIFASTPFYMQGPGVIGRVGEVVSRIGHAPGVIIDSLVRPLVGHLLDESFARPPVSEGFSGELTDAAIAPLIRSFSGCDVIVAVGGGKTLDAGKALALVLGTPFVSVPTIASTDGPASRGIAMYDDEHKLTRVDQLPANPAAVIVDTAIIANAPIRYLRAGIGDAIAKMFEAEACWAGGGLTKHRTRPTHSARAIARAAYGLLRDHAVQGVAAAKRQEVTEDLEATIEATILLSAMGFENGGLSIAHSTTRGLMQLRGARERLHGEHVGYGTLVQIAVEKRPAEMLCDVGGFLQRVGLPSSLTELGVTDVNHAELSAIASAILASPHIGNVAVPLTHDNIVLALQQIEARSRLGWTA